MTVIIDPWSWETFWQLVASSISLIIDAQESFFDIDSRIMFGLCREQKMLRKTNPLCVAQKNAMLGYLQKDLLLGNCLHAR